MTHLQKTHYSAAELAGMGLPGLPSAERSIRIRADREGWAFSEVPARGRTGTRREYAVASLPAEARAALLTRAVATLTPPALPVVTEKALPAPLRDADLTDRQRLERDARAGVLAAVRRLQADTGCSQEAALTTLLTNAAANRLDEHLTRLLQLARDPRGRKGNGYPSVRTLKRWLGAADLAPRVPAKDLQIPAWAQGFLACYQRPEKPSVDAAYQAACAQWGDTRPSIHQVRRFLAKMGSVTRERGRLGERELKNLRPFVRRSFDLLEPNDIWTADGHTFDAEVQHPLHGRPFRPEITLFLDIATRRAVGWSVDLAESSTAVADALRYGVEREGIPAMLYVDNGSGYRNAMLQDEVTGLLGRLGTSIEHSLPYNSQARGVIERAHQTLWVAGAKELPGFIGAAMDREARLEQFKLSRRALKQGGAMPLMPWHLFVQWCEQRVAWYNARPHRSLGNTTPDLALAAFAAQGWAAERMGADELATLFRPRVVRTLARAEIRLFNNLYFARELEEFHGLEAHIAYDIHDASRVWVYAPDGRLICTAEVNGNRKHYYPVPVVEQARQKRAEGRLKKVDAKKEEILAELHGRDALAQPLAQRDTVREALDVTPEARADHAPAPDIAPRPRSERPAAENYADWLALDARIAAGDVVSDADARWHRSFPNSAQYRAHTKKLATGAATRVA